MACPGLAVVLWSVLGRLWYYGLSWTAGVSSGLLWSVLDSLGLEVRYYGLS